MPAHIKSALLGSTLTLPVMGGRLALGTWQGVYLCEHRDHGGSRVIMATAWASRPSRLLRGWEPRWLSGAAAPRRAGGPRRGYVGP